MNSIRVKHKYSKLKPDPVETLFAYWFSCVDFAILFNNNLFNLTTNSAVSICQIQWLGTLPLDFEYQYIWRDLPCMAITVVWYNLFIINSWSTNTAHYRVILGAIVFCSSFISPQCRRISTGGTLGYRARCLWEE